MSLILATGSNLSNKLENLTVAKEILKGHFSFISESEIFESAAVDYEQQPDFYNQLLEFSIPNITQDQAMLKILSIEKELGRLRGVDKGPRIIDIDIIFWGLDTYQSKTVTIPHVSWDQRSFVVRPLQQLPFFKTIEKCFKIPQTFKVEAKPINI
jgi:2-amino-4-hydroxy-6-hydroxymethyldihydropteridine diphosphokinase